MSFNHEPQTSASPIPTGGEAYEIFKSYRSEVDDRFRVDPLEAEFPRLSQALGDKGVQLARAGDNAVETFKIRGALIAMHYANARGVERVQAPSAGNHLLSAVLAAKIQDISITGVIPNSAPAKKRAGARLLWDDQEKFHLQIAGTTFDEARQYVEDHPENGELLHPFDDPYVIRGQGTLADDILADDNDVKHIVIPVGGGGLAAGLLQRLDELGRTDILVHAIEAKGSSSLSLSLAAGEVVAAEAPNSRFGGSAVKYVGKQTLAICQRQNDQLRIHRVTDKEVDWVTADYEQDRVDLMREDTPNYEPTTLVAVAGLTHVLNKSSVRDVVVIGTGHNAPLWDEPKQIIQRGRI